MKKILLLIGITFITLNVKGQSKYTADKYFKEFNYPKAVELYKDIYKRGDDSKLVLSRIGDSYYFNTQTKDAEKWYKLLLDKHKETVNSEYLFRYAQVLKSNGNYEKSDSILLKLGRVDTFDSRSKKLKEVPNYVELYSKEGGDILELHNVSTNTKYSDFGGFSINDKFYFASATPIAGTNNRIYKWNRQPFLNLYEATVVKNDLTTIDLIRKNKLVSPISTRYHESNAVITKNGRTMYFTRDNYDGDKVRRDKNRKIRLKLYKATRGENNNWTNIIELPFNNDEYSNGHPALSPDEKTLYFVSDMPGGYGATDIYKVAIYADNKFGNPENLGGVINTEGREMFPYVDKNHIMYFASDGHLGLGALDIFESRKEENEGFTKPKNLKAPFNSNLDDFGFWINEEETKGFLSSNREGGKGDDDVYSFTLDRKKRLQKPLVCSQVINGLVINANTKAIMPHTSVKLLDEEGKVLETTKSDENGLYTFKASCTTIYKVLASKQDYRPDFKGVHTTPENNGINRADLRLTPLIIDNQIKINPIYFDFDKSNIRPDAQYELEHIVTVMNNHPDMRIRIESHTDSRGGKNYNRSLSDRRAKSTRSYIISRGIPMYRIESAIGYGESQLLNHCDDKNSEACSEEEHQLNRRSYFYIVGGSKGVNVSNKKPTVIDRSYHDKNRK